MQLSWRRAAFCPCCLMLILAGTQRLIRSTHSFIPTTPNKFTTFRQLTANNRTTIMTAAPHKGIAATSTSTKHNRIQAKRVRDLEACGARLRAGHLVAFPTETVYGLGGHAMNEEACQRIFKAKERPLTDPLITHVLHFQDAHPLWAASMDSLEFQILQTLCQHFWPGPLTLVARASDSVPNLVMADTGYCAVRSPSHPIARQLLQAAQIPIAAPSANKFGHVSPTSANHVYQDLQYEDVWIVEHDENEKCHVGVESTVAKLEMIQANQGRLTVLRQGAVSVQDLQDCLQKAGLADHVVVQANLKRATPDNEANVAPGQTIRHYSPHVPSFLVSESCPTDPSLLHNAVVIDFGQRLAKWKNLCLDYRDLSATANSSEAAQVVFETLRWAEQVPSARCILFPHLPSNSQDALTLAVQDRLTRAASGVVLNSLQDAL